MTTEELEAEKTRLQVGLGDAIRRRRKQLGYSQERFAEVAHMARTYFGSIERGEFNVALKNLIAIAHGLGVPLSVLIAEAEHTT